MFGSTVVSTVSSAALAPSAAAAGATPGILVLLSLRGAADGLSLVVPHGDPVYAQARPTIAVPTKELLCKDSMFGLHPALADLAPMWRAGRLAAVHATGLPAPNRSHFAAMEEIEDSAPGSSQRIGWLNRMIGEISTGATLEAVAFGSGIPTVLTGPAPVMSLRDLDDSAIEGTDVGDDWRSGALTTLWEGDHGALGPAIKRAMASSLDLQAAQKQPDRRGTYPDSELGRALASVSRTLRAGIGVTTVTVDSGEWDMHSDVGTLEWGRMLECTADLGASIAAFFADLGPIGERVTLVTLSEFGRRVQENSAGGLDHGWGNVMFLAGAGVKGGKYYGSWPGLTNTLAADLSVTTDYRSVLSEVVTKRMGASSAAVFPGFQASPLGVVG